jgi:hypothetical protein
MNYERPAIKDLSKKIREESDPIWKQVLILDKREASTKDWDGWLHNWNHIVSVCGSEKAAIEYLESI